MRLLALNRDLETWETESKDAVAELDRKARSLETEISGPLGRLRWDLFSTPETETETVEPMTMEQESPAPASTDDVPISSGDSPAGSDGPPPSSFTEPDSVSQLTSPIGS
jgi:hypothetical protein